MTKSSQATVTAPAEVGTHWATTRSSEPMRISRVSILVPLYNEEEFIGPLLDKVLAAPLPAGVDREILVVDDCSTDDSLQIAQAKAEQARGAIRILRHEKNRGKGAAMQTAIQQATGEISIFQDADLEYNPEEYLKLIAPLEEGKADAVYGSRFMITGERRVLYFWHSVANRFLTSFCNMVADLNLKAFRTSLLKSIPLRSNRFGIEPEITIKLARRQVRVYETPISYHGRTYEEGKKIGLKDAIQAIFVIV